MLLLLLHMLLPLLLLLLLRCQEERGCECREDKGFIKA